MKDVGIDDLPTASGTGGKHAEARQLGFSRSVHQLRDTLKGTPGGWALVAWLGHGLVPYHDILLWVGIFFTGWVANLLALRHIERAGSRVERHRVGLMAVAAIDGVCWGLVALLLMAHDSHLDAWLLIVLCGAVSVNMPTYITYPPAFRSLVAAMWVTVSLAALYLSKQLQATPQLVCSLLVYFAFIVHTAKPISAKVIDGIRLQLENAALADQLREALKTMEHQATTDALTGQMNRRALDGALARYAEEAEHRGLQFSILMLDIDHFKKINDTHGHHVGDQALRAVAARVSEQLRVGDSCARYGGEEFVVILPGASLTLAFDVAERICRAVAATPLATTPPLPSSVSIGVAAYVKGTPVAHLLAAADSAVYAAKHGGRNQVRSATLAAA